MYKLVQVQDLQIRDQESEGLGKVWSCLEMSDSGNGRFDGSEKTVFWNHGYGIGFWRCSVHHIDSLVCTNSVQTVPYTYFWRCTNSATSEVMKSDENCQTVILGTSDVYSLSMYAMIIRSLRIGIPWDRGSENCSKRV